MKTYAHFFSSLSFLIWGCSVCVKANFQKACRNLLQCGRLPKERSFHADDMKLLLKPYPCNSSIKIHIALRALQLWQKHCHSWRALFKVCFSLMTSTAPETYNSYYHTWQLRRDVWESSDGWGKRSFIKRFAKQEWRELESLVIKTLGKSRWDMTNSASN